MNTARPLLRRLVPASLFARLSLILLAGLAAAQLLTTTVTIDERNDVTMGTMIDYVETDLRTAVALLDRLPPAERPAWLPRLARGGYRFLLTPPESGPPVSAPHSRRLLDSVTRALASDYAFSAHAVPGKRERLQVHVRLSDGAPLTVDFLPRRGLPLSPWLPWVLAGQLALVALACWLAVRQATRPLRMLAETADALGPDLRPVHMPEHGPSEVVRAARAFNAMQGRIAAYVDERLRMLAAISHDLQTPITRMRLRVELMDDEAQQRRLTEDLQQLEDLARQGIGYARAMHGKPELARAVDVDDLLDSLVLDYRDGGADVALTGRCGAPAMTRPGALRRVVTNLVDNALKYAGAAQVVVECDSAIIIRVFDHGPGIPAGALEAVFEPFYRVEDSRNRDTGGSGLGLAIARQLAAALDGTLTLHNRPGGGLEARLVLPFSRT
ncbi:ATP-binding protein [Pseudoduganella plicata]|uniref:histidine kinase n=1 Tax=Pseudoduganella plicata TaxID=321984 RepID=A0A4P7BMJ1_9BURK|nr:HAMP domain-containing sensor histidine kinase [Pseudoduganella plicata]QBQ38965.1 HAMP domain-containing histidine kinase [Pseudoduganella plicata]GGY86109.1 two-component sensor histidine kinase [Pseudoduganella plicata]